MAAVIAASCGSPVEGPIDAIKLSIAVGPAGYEDVCGITSVVAYCSGLGDETLGPFQLAVERDGNKIVGISGGIEGIPEGADRTLEVKALHNDLVVYEGKTYLTVVKGRSTEVSITLYRNYLNCP